LDGNAVVKEVNVILTNFFAKTTSYRTYFRYFPSVVGGYGPIPEGQVSFVSVVEESGVHIAHSGTEGNRLSVLISVGVSTYFTLGTRQS
jgi:hypothetical protein